METNVKDCIEFKIENLQNKFNNYSKLLNYIKNHNLAIIY